MNGCVALQRHAGQNLQNWCRQMPSVKLTDSLLRGVERPAAGVVRYWDTDIKGFVAYVQPKATTLYFQRDIGGKTHRDLIGRFPTVTLPIARETAKELAYRSGRGAAKHIVSRRATVGEATDYYLQNAGLRSVKHAAFVKKAIDDLGWSSVAMSEVTPDLVLRAQKKLLSRGATTANRVLQAFRTVWNFWRDKKDPTLHECPTRALAWSREEPTANAPIVDLNAWDAAVSAVENPVHRAMYRVALYTGLRRGEVQSLEWAHIDEKEMTIFIPVNKSDRPFHLPITQRHLDLFEEMRGLDDRWVFPASSKTGHAQEWRHEEVPGTLHSLRHTFATVAVEAGIPEETVGRLLNHAGSGKVTSRYVKPQLGFLRGVMTTICDELDRRRGATDD